ncbi:hypothetical protein ALP36_103059 [Pseudomonas syringae pv. coriandricola]|uniref:Uncharacterized protein n=2 Tax=Pseudomonas syringae group TaxID=136849 RepID=A0A0P9R1Z9_PSECA|nr:hypothetical protein PSYMP_22418 [Pseudomonas amygdali pv. morsprunorum str. M302280]KPW77248.1 hypothetical protein ALO81_102476 [Pseudomonas cannabina]KPW77250.1 hypothetical protein ALO76_102525 [Pseudomonas syringae pv. coriandricola]KUG45864.1 hypothetical protein ALP79_200074 [Pseudomonas savastanoi pv. fraxini]RMN02482.1 hypothetical protein ALQ69_104195 [Pseudomonas savastanoi pv. glycinea]RMO18672.1 hypothetical protein ALQ46_102919 [Pseudomonas savastanoi pv. phaseolicola]RMP2516
MGRWLVHEWKVLIYRNALAEYAELRDSRSSNEKS